MAKTGQQRKRRRTLIVTGLVLLIVVGPVVVAQLFPAERRHFERVSLEDTRYEEIEFRNERQNLDLAGMLFLPEAQGPVPVAVIIHGSGTSRRGNGWYLTLTQYLQNRGIAVLLPDKRGSEKSSGDWRTADFHDLATDTIAAVDAVKARPEVDPSRIGLIGMSQGGWIAPIVANEAADVAWVVSMVGSAVTPTEQLAFEEVHNLRQMGFLPGVAHVIAAMSTRYIKNVAQAEFWERIEDYDPLPYWETMPVAALALFGRDDTNVPSLESAARLERIDNPRIDIEVYEGSGHPLESPEGLGNSIIRRDALERIASFITEI